MGLLLKLRGHASCMATLGPLAAAWRYTRLLLHKNGGKAEAHWLQSQGWQVLPGGGSIPSRSDAVWSRGPYFYWQYDNSAESLDAIEGACRRSAALGWLTVLWAETRAHISFLEHGAWIVAACAELTSQRPVWTTKSMYTLESK
mmetsp:Transcript_566/g.1810  ORF Transcript_566/g.1810 Transcript_566/m.1810 type:complete len:144 (-) Transcript_566:3-434(-)